MSREIKFRAYIKKTDENEGEMIYQESKSDFMMISNGNGIHVVFDCEEYIDDEGFEIMQYTGLKDKHGKDIYESDVVYISGLGNRLVKWCEYNLQFLFVTEKYSDEYEDVTEDVERVIGNIYENPELMEK